MAAPLIEVDRADLARFQRDMKRLAPQVIKEFRKDMRTVMKPVADEAKRNAGWSSRIPGAIGLKVTAKKVGIRVSAARAPHGAPYEGKNVSGGSFRHPVFGNRNAWVSQTTRPFIQPAVDANADKITEGLADAVTKAASAVGWT